MKTKWIIILVLGLILALLFLIKTYWPPCLDDDGFFINLITEVIGLLLTVLIVDSLVQSSRERENRRLRAVAFESFEQPLRSITRAWLIVAYGGDNNARENLSGELGEHLMSDQFFTALQSRSFNDTPSDGSMIGPLESFRVRFPKVVDHFQRGVSETLRIYGHALTSNELRLLQHFNTGAHLYNIVRFWQSVDIGDNQWFYRATKEQLSMHFERFCNLLSLYNSLTTSERQIRSGNVMNLRRVSGDVPNVEW